VAIEANDAALSLDYVGNDSRLGRFPIESRADYAPAPRGD
jgi:hypothetical protein